MDWAWNWNEFLTPHGKKLRDECLKNVNFRDYHITITVAAEDQWNCTVGYRNYREKLCYFKKNFFFHHSLEVVNAVHQKLMEYHATT
jgi:hypothetical protein